MRTDDLLEAARELSIKERVRLARRLLDTVVENEDDGKDVEAAWRVEIERRVKQVREGRAGLEDTATVLRELEAELAAGRRRARRTEKPRSRIK